MSEKPTAHEHSQGPKSENGRLSRSAEALRANLIKRKAQQRARTEKEGKPDEGHLGSEEAD